MESDLAAVATVVLNLKSTCGEHIVGQANGLSTEKPSCQCRPPTARPGASMHERGLAIDFTQNGHVCGTSGYRWLKRNAAKYGFRNLPSEPWHWSTNGR